MVGFTSRTGGEQAGHKSKAEQSWTSIVDEGGWSSSLRSSWALSEEEERTNVSSFSGKCSRSPGRVSVSSLVLDGECSSPIVFPSSAPTELRSRRS